MAAIPEFVDRVIKDPWSWLTHFAGFVLGMIGAGALIEASLHEPVRLAAMTTYGASMIALFGSSCLYHFYDLGERGNLWLQRLDHVAIYVFIAGSYVPFLVHTLEGDSRVVMLCLICGLAVIGLTIKAFWMTCPDALMTAMYVIVGWAILPVAHIVIDQLTATAGVLLFGGGIAYTLGAVVFVKERPDPWPGVFGHHEVWHLFVLAGAGMHFAAVHQLLAMPIAPF